MSNRPEEPVAAAAAPRSRSALPDGLAHAAETAWQALAGDLLERRAAGTVAEAEAAARRQLEELAFDALCRRPGPDDSPAASFRQAILAEDPPADILEALHQHLLSRQLHRRAGGGLRCRAHRGTRRSQGIYYTPDYIADYLVRHCLADTGRSSTPRILDPACGCGRFLLAAAHYLLRQGRPAAEIARSLHGRDLDSEAIEVARRILALTLVPSQAAPDTAQISATLRHNLTCADALADPLPAAPSFDVVLGNPPYRRERGAKALLDRVAGTGLRRYRSPRMDLAYYFLHRGIELLAPGGRLGFILGAYWTAGRGAGRLIATLRQSVHLDEIFLLDRLQVFPQVAGHHVMLVLSKPPSDRPTTVRLPLADRQSVARDYVARDYVAGPAPVHSFTKTAGQLFRHGQLDLEPPAEQLLERLSLLPTLGRLGKVRQGIAENPAGVTRAANAQHGSPWRVGQGVFALTPDELERLGLPPEERGLIRPYHDLCDLGRYHWEASPSRRLIYSTRETWPRLQDFPVLAAHLARFRPILEARRETRQGARAWWHLHWPREPRIWEVPKLVALQMAPRPSFAVAHAPTWSSFSTNVFVPGPQVREDLRYFAAILNSRLLWKWFQHHAKRRGVGLEINGHVLARAPIRPADFACPLDVARHDRLVELADQMQNLSCRRRIAGRPHPGGDWETIDAEIDRLVYELYGLSAADIDAVDSACREN
ncbi:MAG: Eco57I restriction-modification methylase domain-containing protein [Thermoguttaceae bacterium]